MILGCLSYILLLQANAGLQPIPMIPLFQWLKPLTMIHPTASGDNVDMNGEPIRRNPNTDINDDIVYDCFHICAIPELFSALWTLVSGVVVLQRGSLPNNTNIQA